MDSISNISPPPIIPQEPKNTQAPGRYSKAIGIILMVFSLICINYGAWDFYGQLTRAEKLILQEQGLDKAPEMLSQISFSGLETAILLKKVKSTIGRNVALFALKTTFFSTGLVVGFFIFLKGDRKHRPYANLNFPPENSTPRDKQ